MPSQAFGPIVGMFLGLPGCILNRVYGKLITTQIPHNYHTTTTQLLHNYYTTTTQLPHNYHATTTHFKGDYRETRFSIFKILMATTRCTFWS